ncbi:MAG TPA: sulfatase-like hydrolase/transferase, partial [Vicinamibacterales bacterium]|nr:sulfatase-like hydrolase/transferase [Vicinamibacterales bacterium]
DPDATDRLEAERRASVVVDHALRWMDAHEAPQAPQAPQTPQAPQAPWFVWIHVYDPHAPYAPPAGYPQSYDGELMYADAQIQRVFEWLDQRQLTRSTFIVVAGDHGEGLGDHGESTHGMLLYDSTLRVPLIVVDPSKAASVDDRPISLTAIAPMILGAIKKPDTEPSSDVYAETEYPRVAGWSPLQALTDGRWKAIRADATTELYDLQTDPGEQRDVARSQAGTAAALTTRIAAIRSSTSGAAPTAISADAQERLRALGYVASSVQPTAQANAPSPSANIAVWNAFEDALSLLNAREPSALPRLAALAQANPDAPVLQTTYAQALRDAHRSADALAVYRSAARKWPTDATLLHDLAAAARDAGQMDEAKKADEAAIALAPDSALAHNGAGLIAIDQRRPSDAVREFERATTIDPTNASYWTNLGNARRAAGDGRGAEDAYRHALAVDARAVDAANGLGVVLVEAHRAAEAVPLFERAVAASPDFVEAKLNLGIALEQSGQRDRARATYRDVLKAPARFVRERDAATKLLGQLDRR